MSTRPVKVFISYSHDSKAHAERVLALADRLRGDGLDCLLDQYDPAPPQGWPRWMEDQLEAADFVLVVSTAGYQRRAGGKERPKAGRGVRFESVLLVQDLYDAGMWNERFIPVLVGGATEADIIRPLRGYTYYVVDTEEGYEALCRRLTGQPLTRKPDLGEVKTLPPREAARRGREPSTRVKSSEPAGSIVDREPFRKRWQGRVTFVGAALAIPLAIVAMMSGMLDLPEKWRKAKEAVVDTEEVAIQVLEGQIVDAETTLPLPGVEVVLAVYGERRITDDLGRYRFELQVPEYTRVALQATLEGYSTINEDPMVGGYDTISMRKLK